MASEEVKNLYMSKTNSNLTTGSNSTTNIVTPQNRGGLLTTRQPAEYS